MYISFFAHDILFIFPITYPFCTVTSTRYWLTISECNSCSVKMIIELTWINQFQHIRLFPASHALFYGTICWYSACRVMHVLYFLHVHVSALIDLIFTSALCCTCTCIYTRVVGESIFIILLEFIHFST